MLRILRGSFVVAHGVFTGLIWWRRRHAGAPFDVTLAGHVRSGAVADAGVHAMKQTWASMIREALACTHAAGQSPSVPAVKAMTR